MMHDHKTYRFCPQCGGRIQPKQLKKIEPERLVCTRCGFIFYLDPKVAACVIIEVEKKIVLLKRGISPAYGKWVIPGGFVNLGETTPDAAAREAWEEVRLKVEVKDLVGVYSYPLESVVVIVYEAAVIDGTLKAADETLAVRLFTPLEIPWKRLAFSSTRDALEDYLEKHSPEFRNKAELDREKT